MNISEVQESNGGGSGSRTLYTGIENFEVTAVNPTMAELNAMGIPATVEPEYLMKIKRDYGDGEKEYDMAIIRLYLTNNDPAIPINTSVSYTLINTHQLSSTDKYNVINKYGSSTWLTEEQITGKEEIPGNMKWYITDDVKKAIRGEEALITFLKAYRNLPNISMKVDQADRSKGIAYLEQADIDRIFKGDFSDLRKAIMDKGQEGKCGFLLGVKNLDNGKTVQDIYKEQPLKRYVKHTVHTDNNAVSYVIKEVINSQGNGAYANTVFDLVSTELKEYDNTKVAEPTDEDTLTPSMVGYEDETDDLPF